MSTPQAEERGGAFRKGRALESNAMPEAADAAPGGAAYSLNVTSDIDANERGVATFKGKYVIQYTLRQVLTDNRRAPALP